MGDLLGIFIAGYLSTFLLGFQSRSVNTGKFAWAAGGSFLIAIAQASIWTKITAPSAGWTGSLVYGISGALAITSSMYVHKRWITKKEPTL